MYVMNIHEVGCRKWWIFIDINWNEYWWSNQQSV